MSRWASNTVALVTLAAGLVLAGATAWGCCGLAEQFYLFMQDLRATVRQTGMAEQQVGAAAQQTAGSVQVMQGDVHDVAAYLQKHGVHVF